jgi:hypothetical protein
MTKKLEIFVRGQGEFHYGHSAEQILSQRHSWMELVKQDDEEVEDSGCSGPHPHHHHAQVQKYQ